MHASNISKLNFASGRTGRTAGLASSRLVKLSLSSNSVLGGPRTNYKSLVHLDNFQAVFIFNSENNLYLMLIKKYINRVSCSGNLLCATDLSRRYWARKLRAFLLENYFGSFKVKLKSRIISVNVSKHKFLSNNETFHCWELDRMNFWTVVLKVVLVLTNLSLFYLNYLRTLCARKLFYKFQGQTSVTNYCCYKFQSINFREIMKLSIARCFIR